MFCLVICLKYYTLTMYFTHFFPFWRIMGVSSLSSLTTSGAAWASICSVQIQPIVVATETWQKKTKTKTNILTFVLSQWPSILFFSNNRASPNFLIFDSEIIISSSSFSISQFYEISFIIAQLMFLSQLPWGHRTSVYIKYQKYCTNLCHSYFCTKRGTLRGRFKKCYLYIF